VRAVTRVRVSALLRGASWFCPRGKRLGDLGTRARKAEGASIVDIEE
jgi:hypothetical protein